MSTESLCPGPAELRQFFAGQLAGLRAEQVAGHVGRCAGCRAFPDAAAGLETRSAPGPGPGADVTLPPAPAGAAGYAFLSPPRSGDELGRLGPYRVLKVLGSGGMGVVFLAEDPHLQRRVALKTLLPALAAAPAARERFLREARAAAAVKHDHVVTIYQVSEDQGVPFLAMEYLEGQSLEARLRRERRLPAGEVVRVGREIAEGLAAAHGRGLVHRDVKPANVWLEAGRGRVKLLDFGLARAGEDAGVLSSPGAVIGTPGYMAPEQARGEKVDFRCDLFGLGCVLYRLGTGVPPFKGPDAVSTLLAVCSHAPPPPQTLNPELPPSLCDLIMRLLAKRPEDRPASAR